jgi:hypothetical protein
MKKAFWYQIHLFLLELVSLRAAPPSHLSHVLCGDHLLPALLRVRLHPLVYHHLLHHHGLNKSVCKSKSRAGASGRGCIQRPTRQGENKAGWFLINAISYR